MNFADAMSTYYLPSTLNVYKTKKIDKPYARLDNPNTFDDIKNGLKGTILSNYYIESVKYYIKGIQGHLKRL